MKNIMALYHNLVFRCWYVNHPKSNKVESFFVDIFEGDEKSFMKRYKKECPNCNFQTFKGKKPLSKLARSSIEKLIRNDKSLQKLIRDYKINKILNGSSYNPPNLPRTY
jgi:hypothetical protein